MKRLAILVFMIILTLGFLSHLIVFAQQSSNDSVSINNEQQASAADTANKTGGKRDTSSKDLGKRGFSVETLWGLIEAAAEFGYLLALDFILGAIFLFQQFFVLKREMDDSNKIPLNEIPKLGYDELEKMFTQVKEDDTISIENEREEMQNLPMLKRLFRRKKASAYQLANRLFLIFRHQRSTASFNEVTDSFIQYLKDMFNPFVTRMAFLSDTAGALGLLGTVWGMFMVFHRGDPTQKEILAGMGVALSTTIIGLVISIFLNSLTTIVTNRFDRQLAIINKVNEVLQERLMREEVGQPGSPAQVIVDPNTLAQLKGVVASSAQMEEATPQDGGKQSKAAATRKKKIRQPSEIKIVNGNNQTAEVGTEITEPFAVEVLDQEGNPLEGQEVTFIAEDGAGNFPNDSRIRKILTDEEGRAETSFFIGKKAGDKKITVSLDGADVQPKSLLIMAKPTPAEKLIEIDGNYQTCEMGKRLEKPFVVAVRDKFDNPIPRYEVNFSLARGSGRFQDSQNAHLTAHTNEAGLVEVYFIAGNERGSRDIEIEAKKVSPSKLNFEVFAK